MLEETVARFVGYCSLFDIYVSTNDKYKTVVREILPELPEENIIIEPDKRDTASAIGLAAAVLQKRFPNSVMGMFAADHLIKKPENFIRALGVAEQAASEGDKTVLFGAKPTFPSTELGYIRTGSEIKNGSETAVHTFKGFQEKPDLKTAKQYFQSLDYLWNMGNFVFRTDFILNLYKEYLPQSYELLMEIQKAWDTDEQTKVLNKLYPQLEKISIDYAIMEKVDQSKVLVIPVDMGWSDVGNWAVLKDELAGDEKANIIHANHLGIDSSGLLVYGDPRKLIATIDLEDMLVVDTEDALLICPKSSASKVKDVVEKLKKEGRKSLT